MHPKQIAVTDFSYRLPVDKIASLPLEKRDESKLLVYENEAIREDIYKNISHYLPAGSLMIFNDTKVIRARIDLLKPTGGRTEVFCLEPYCVNDYALAMAKTGMAVWKCLIRRAGKWKNTLLEKSIHIGGKEVNLTARIKETDLDTYLVEFCWDPPHFTFAEILEQAGDIPLPPYIKRKTNSADKERYQTIYAASDGSVAAPTAGLHFTPHIFHSLKSKSIDIDFVTLHVGAGTFKPVKATLMADHEMHAEFMDVQVAVIEKLLGNIRGNIIAVGTTSVRTLESLYWMGIKTYLQPDCDAAYLAMQQWEIYEAPFTHNELNVEVALKSLISWMQARRTDRLFVKTQLIIAPGYRFRLVNALITNFHQPFSTLLLLVAAAAGNAWGTIYDYALQNNFRFLSYGDGCLIYCSKGSTRYDQEP